MAHTCVLQPAWTVRYYKSTKCIDVCKCTRTYNKSASPNTHACSMIMLQDPPHSALIASRLSFIHTRILLSTYIYVLDVRVRAHAWRALSVARTEWNPSTRWSSCSYSRPECRQVCIFTARTHRVVVLQLCSPLGTSTPVLPSSSVCSTLRIFWVLERRRRNSLHICNDALRKTT